MIAAGASRICKAGRAAGILCLLGFGLAGCMQGQDGPGAVQSVNQSLQTDIDAVDASVTPAAGSRISAALTPAPDVFEARGLAIWDGAPTLQGIWVAHPKARTARRVRIIDTFTRRAVDGALFRRDEALAGSTVLISSEAATLLGLAPNEKSEILIVALKPKELEEVAEAEAPTETPEAEVEEVETELAAADPADTVDEPAAGEEKPAQDAVETASADETETPAESTEEPIELALAPVENTDVSPEAETTATVETPDAEDKTREATVPEGEDTAAREEVTEEVAEDPVEQAAVADAEPAPADPPAETDEDDRVFTFASADDTPAQPVAKPEDAAKDASDDATETVSDETADQTSDRDFKFLPRLTTPEEPAEDVEIAVATPNAPAEEPEAETPATDTPAFPEPAETATPASAPPKRGLVVLAGVFGVADNATRLSARIREAGYPAGTEVIKGRSGNLTKVIAGPFDNAQTQAAALAKIRQLGVPDAIASKR